MTPEIFEDQRPRLVDLAYRMLGQVQRAEDLVQETWLRSTGHDVRDPRRWLTQVLTRLCVDELRSAARRREAYPGPWLPEPSLRWEPEADLALRESAQTAFLLALEGLTPPQRAAFLLRDVFDHDYGDIAQILDLAPATVRQHVSRGRRVLRELPPMEPDPEVHGELLQAFAVAVTEGELEPLVALLHADCTAWSDGGGKVHAARVPIHGARRVAKAYLGFAKMVPDDLRATPCFANGLPALLLATSDGTPISVMAVGVRGGRIMQIWSQLNPDKLAAALRAASKQGSAR